MPGIGRNCTFSSVIDLEQRPEDEEISNDNQDLDPLSWGNPTAPSNTEESRDDQPVTPSTTDLNAIEQPVASSSATAPSIASTSQDVPHRASSPGSAASTEVANESENWLREDKEYRKNGIIVRDYAFAPVYVFNPKTTKRSTSDSGHYETRGAADIELPTLFDPYTALATHDFFLAKGSTDLWRIDLNAIDPVFFYLVTGRLPGRPKTSVNPGPSDEPSDDNNLGSSQEEGAKAAPKPTEETTTDSQPSQEEPLVAEAGPSGEKSKSAGCGPSKGQDPPDDPSGPGSSQVDAPDPNSDAFKLLEALKRFFPSARLEPRVNVVVLEKEDVKAILQPYLEGCLAWWNSPEHADVEAKDKGKGKGKAKAVLRSSGVPALQEKLKEYELPFYRTDRAKVIKERNDARKRLLEMRMKAEKLLEQTLDARKKMEQTKTKATMKGKAKSKKAKNTEVPPGLTFAQIRALKEQAQLEPLKEKIIRSLTRMKLVDEDVIKAKITTVLVEELKKEDTIRAREAKKKERMALPKGYEYDFRGDAWKSRKLWIEEMLGDAEGELNRFIDYEVTWRNSRPPSGPITRDILPSDLFVEPASEKDDPLSSDPSFTFTPLSLLFTFGLHTRRVAPILGPVTSRLLEIGWLTTQDQKRWLPVDRDALAFYQKANENRRGGVPFTIRNPKGEGWEEVLGRTATMEVDEDAGDKGMDVDMDVDEEFVVKEKKWKGKEKAKPEYPLPPTKEERRHMLNRFLTYGCVVEPEYSQLQKVFKAHRAPWDNSEAPENQVPNACKVVDKNAGSPAMENVGESSQQGHSAKNKRKADEQPIATSTKDKGMMRLTKKRRTEAASTSTVPTIDAPSNPIRVTRQRVRDFAERIGVSMENALERYLESFNLPRTPSPIPDPAPDPVVSEVPESPSSLPASSSPARTPTPTGEDEKSKAPARALTMRAMGRQSTMFYM